MSEMAKTLAFVAVGIVSLVGAFATKPGYEEFDVQSEVGKLLNQFEVETAKRLKIVTFDDETAETREFEVAEEDGLWTIPSKQGYPADAVRQMAAAATCLIDRELLRVAGENAAQHADLGLIDPSSGNLNVDSKGVGTRVTMTDLDGVTLVDMVIGNQVLDTDDQYYVRNADQDYAYTIQLDPEPLTTKFENWIEKDLLNLNAMDVERIAIKDYSAELVFTLQGLRVNWDRRGELQLAYDDENSKWLAEDLKSFDPDKAEMVSAPLSEEEELDEDKLRDLRYALDDLTIVDVERKPEGLSSDLQAGSEFLDNPEAVQSLIGRGFAPLSVGGSNDAEILSSEGEIICTLKDGVEYILRFGNVQLESDETAENPADGATEAKDDDGIHRYLFVMARLNEAVLEQPELESLPELPAGVDEAALQASSEETVEEAAVETDNEADTESEEASEPAADGAVAEADSAEAESSENESSGAETAETEETNNPSAELARLIAERESIERENKRRLEEYQQKLADAKKTVRNLNERFGDWYYVIDNKVYKELNLGRDDVVKQKQQEETEPADSAGESAAGSSAPGIPALPGS